MVVELNREINLNRLYTTDEFEELDWPDNDNLYELIGGQIVMTPPPGGEHALIGYEIMRAVILFDPESKLGKIFENAQFKLGAGFAPAPDIAFIKKSDLVSVTKKAITVVPGLAIEILSPGDLDTKNHRERNQRKIRDYQLAGVSIIWSINPKEHIVEVYHPNEIEPQIKRIGDDLDGEGVLPGFKLTVAKLFA